MVTYVGLHPTISTLIAHFLRQSVTMILIVVVTIGLVNMFVI